MLFHSELITIYEDTSTTTLFSFFTDVPIQHLTKMVTEVLRIRSELAAICLATKTSVLHVNYGSLNKTTNIQESIFSGQCLLPLPLAFPPLCIFCPPFFVDPFDPKTFVPLLPFILLGSFSTLARPFLATDFFPSLLLSIF